MGAKDFLGGVAVGAGLVYFLEPERGPRRRERLRAKVGGVPDTSGGYGSRLGDIEGLGAANLGNRRLVSGGPRLAHLAGGALLAYGVLRRGRTGRALRTAGLTLATAGLRRMVPIVRSGRERRRVVDIQQTLYVEAPIERVFAFWSHYDNYPLFMSTVRRVDDLGGSRSRWVLNGPGGLPVEWNAVLTDREENRRLAWRSEPGSMLENAGAVRFAREGAGTRIDFRFCYNPPAGRAGRAMAEFFGADPRVRLTEDLGRLRSLLEIHHREE